MSRQQRCSVHGTFMAQLGSDSDWYVCRVMGCKEIRSSKPGMNFGLMLLGFTSKAARPS